MIFVRLCVVARGVIVRAFDRGNICVRYNCDLRFDAIFSSAFDIY